MARKTSFGEREAGVPAPSLERDEISEDLRIAVWNVCDPWLFNATEDQLFKPRMKALWRGLNWPADDAGNTSSRYDLEQHVKGYLLNERHDWIKFYGFVELIPQLAVIHHSGNQLTFVVSERINEALEQYGSQYRLINGQLAPITNEQELREIKEAAAAAADRFAPARGHISQAIAHLAARPEPAYRDCIKEAVIALESVVWIATGGEKKPDFKVALREFEKQHGELHGALSSAIRSLYGYASDEEGVRHGATELSDVDEGEARLILVTSSALVNFLIRQAEGV